VIIRAKVVVTMEGPPIANGGIAVNEGKIVDVGTFDEVKTRNAGEVVDLGDSALLPGLINAHCHLDYTCLRGKIPRPKSFADWIRAINGAKAKLSPDDYIRSIEQGFAEAKRFGTTTIGNLTAFPELVARIDAPVRTWWFGELIDVRDPTEANQIVARSAQQLRSMEFWGLAPHAPFTASADLYRRCEEVARRDNVLLTTHLAESKEEMSMFRNASGPLYDFLAEIGRDMSDCGAETPLSVFLNKIKDSSTSRLRPATARQAVGMTGNWILVHLNELTENDFDLLARSKVPFSVVHCPRSHGYFEHNAFPFEKLKGLGLNICLGTDSLASNDDLSLFAEMRAFQRKFPSVAAEDILSMVTANGARAFGQEKSIGKVKRGYLPDLIALPYHDGDPFEAIVAFAGEPRRLEA
jgi:cytosine/adenosine deaminase-related metal-dependent hydrolase